MTKSFFATPEETRQAVADPQPGMYFTERFAYRIFVLMRDGDIVTWSTSSGAQENYVERCSREGVLPEPDVAYRTCDMNIYRGNLEDFRKVVSSDAYVYVDLINERLKNVEGIAKGILQQRSIVDKRPIIKPSIDGDFIEQRCMRVE